MDKVMTDEEFFHLEVSSTQELKLALWKNQNVVQLHGVLIAFPAVLATSNTGWDQPSTTSHQCGLEHGS